MTAFEDRKRQEAIAVLLGTLREEGIEDQGVLDSIATVPRERFIPEALASQAWANDAIPIGFGQTISQPFVVALMTQALALTGSERMLEIGTGSGYQTAILARLAASVISIERYPELAIQAREVLDGLGYRNVAIHVGDGTVGYPAAAPYDAIIVTAAAPAIPEPLLRQLSPAAGRMVIPVGDAMDQDLLLVTRRDQGLRHERLSRVRFVPLIGRAGWRLPQGETPPDDSK